MKKALLLALTVFTGTVAAAEDPAGLDTLRAAATRGDIEAQLELGILYEYGFRHADHLVPALAWYLRAADMGNPEAAKRRDALMGKLPPAEVEQARRLAPALLSGAPAQKPVPTVAPATAPAEPSPAPASAAEPSPTVPVPSTVTENTAANKPLF